MQVTHHLPPRPFIFIFFGQKAARIANMLCNSSICWNQRRKSQHSPLRSQQRAEKSDLLQQTANTFNISRAAIPFILIGSRGIIGYDSDATTGATIKQAILNCRRTHCADGMLAVKALQKTHKQLASSPANAYIHPYPAIFPYPSCRFPCLRLPWVLLMASTPAPCGCLYSCLACLPALKVAQGAGCSQHLCHHVSPGVLPDHGCLAEYPATAWLRHLGAPCDWRYSTRHRRMVDTQYFANPEVICRVSQSPARRAFLEKLRKTALSPSLVFAFIGIILLAGAVNVVELLCSSGIPATFSTNTGAQQSANMATSCLPWPLHPRIHAG